MQNYLFAKRYAKGLIDVAREMQKLEVVERDMMYLKTLCELSSDFLFLLENPLISFAEKSRAVTAVCNGKIDELSMHFLHLLIKKHREAYILKIISAFYKEYNSIKELYKVKLTTAMPASEAVKQLFIDKIKSGTPLKNIELTCIVEKELIGGFILEFNDKTIDASLRRGIKELEKRFKEARVVPRILNLTDFDQLLN